MAKDPPERKIPIVRKNPKDLPATFINDVIVHHTSDSFYITFSQLEVPAVASEAELRKITEIQAIAEHKIVVTPEYFQKIVAALTTNLKIYLGKQDGDSDE